MSHKKDRERAESGTIFRNGQYWSKKDWNILHPSKQGMAEANVSSRAIIPWLEPAEEQPTEKPYFCAKCKRTHKPGSKVYQAHKEVANGER